MNFLEQLANEYLAYKGNFVRTNKNSRSVALGDMREKLIS